MAVTKEHKDLHVAAVVDEHVLPRLRRRVGAPVETPKGA